MAVELATAYVSIVPDTSKIAPGVRKALTGVDGQAAAAGKSAGSKMSAALGTALKGGALAAGTAAAAGIGVALTKGFQRLSAIDDAKGKLEGLGHTTQSTQKIMDSALESVKGTAYGLGDAATIAASAVAAGVKPGQQLTKYLSSIGDAASIAGTGLSEMGLIFNQVQTGQAAYTDDLNQLASRGIPIYQWLAEEAKVSAGEVKKLASEGKISSEMFFNAINKNIGGAALSAGKTVRGSFQNMLAAMGRLGAAAEQPFFKRLPGTFTSATSAIDAMTPRVTALATQLDSKIFEEWGPKIQRALQSARDSGSLAELESTVRGLVAALEGAGPSIGTIMTELARASSAIGIGTWQLFLAALNAGVGALNMLNPLLSTTAHLMEDHRAVVTALVGAWVAFKTVPGLLDRVGGPLRGLTTQASSARVSLTAFGEQMKVQQSLARMSGTEIGRMGAAMAVLGTKSSSLSAMQKSFYSASDGAGRFSVGLGVAKAAGTGLKSGLGALAGMFGGPYGLALTGAVVAGGAVISSVQKQHQQVREYESALAAVAKQQRATNALMMESAGRKTDQVWSSLTSEIDKYRTSLDKASAADGKWWQVGSVKDKWDARAGAAQSARRAYDELGLSAEDLSRKVYGSRVAWEQFSAQLRASGADGARLADDLSQVRGKFVATEAAARQSVPGISALHDAISTFGDESASATDKANALKSAMDALNPAQGAAEAMIQYGDAARAASASLDGIDSSAFKADGSLDGATESGKALYNALNGLAKATADVASNGSAADLNAALKSNEEQFAALAQATGKTKEEIRGLYQDYGGRVVELAVALKGQPQVLASLNEVKVAMDRAPSKKSIVLSSKVADRAALTELDRMDVAYAHLGNGNIQIDASGDAREKIDAVLKKVSDLKGKLPVEAALTMKTVQFDASNTRVRAEMEALRNAKIDPKVKLIIDDLLAGKNISVAELNALSRVVADPKVDVQTDAAKSEIEDIKNRLNEVNGKHYSSFMDVVTNLVTAPGTGHMPTVPGVGGLVPTNANGSIRQYAAGGIALAEAYANGGTRLPDRALIQKPDPKGGLVQWAEPETGGEAFIPLASRKRKRSTDILGAVADIFGYALVPKDSISATLGDAISGSVAGLAKRAGVDRVTKFADGGITADKLKQYMRGADGATYIRGGWGQGYNTDCSGEQSVAAEATKGNLSPGTGERAGTAAFSSYLPSQGYTIGMAPAGVPAHEIGWSSEHASGTIFDPVGGDVNFEMGGQNGGGAYGGGAVSSRDGQFPNHAWKRLADAVVVASPGTTDTTPDTTALTPDTSTTPTSPTVDQPTTFSGRLGGAAGAFVSGQLQSLFGVLGVNDSPGALAALSEAERQRQQKNGDDKSIRDAVQKGADPKKLREAQDKVTDTEKSLSIAQQRLREVEANPKSSESSKLAAKARVEKLERELAQARADLESLKKQIKNTPTTTPQAGDTGVGNLTGVDAVKAIVQRVLNPRGWGSGEQWAATDWIAQHESSWNPKARNGKYSGVFQLGPEAWAAAGIEPTDDPAKQAEAYAHYVAGRYKLPTAAKAFWEQNHWYDRGGIAPDVGLMLKNTNRPERVLSPQQTQSFEQMVKRDFQSGVGTDQVIQRLDRLIALTERVYEKVGAGETHNHFPDYGSARADAAAVARDRKQRAMMAGA